MASGSGLALLAAGASSLLASAAAAPLVTNCRCLPGLQSGPSEKWCLAGVHVSPGRPPSCCVLGVVWRPGGRGPHYAVQGGRSHGSHCVDIATARANISDYSVMMSTSLSSCANQVLETR